MKALWEFLNSLKLTVYLILAITALTMFGSMVLYVHPEIFGGMDQDLLFHWLTTKGLSSPVYTWWLYLLVVLVVLLGVNTMVCTIERLPLVIKRYKNPLMNLRDIEVGGDAGRTVALKGPPRDVISAFFRKNGYEVFTDGDRLYAEKNRWLPFIPYVVHAGIMLFMAGHLISSMYGYRNTGLFIFEGESAKSPGGDYQIRLDKVNAEYYPDGSPKKFGSSITALKDGKVIKTGVVTANSPMFVEGGAVYQREYGKTLKGLSLHARVKTSGFSDYLYVPRNAATVEIPGTDYRIMVSEFIPDFGRDGSGAPYSLSEDMVNPAARVVLIKKGAPKATGWAILNEPDNEGLKDDDVEVKLSSLDLKAYSSFDVNRDPSAITVLIASMAVMFGTLVTLYFRRERVWAKIDEEGGGAQVQCTDYELYEKMGSIG